MRVTRWGTSLAVRIPVAVVEALDLREGDESEINAAGAREFEATRSPTSIDLLKGLRIYRGLLPADFKFDRLAANRQ